MNNSTCEAKLVPTEKKMHAYMSISNTKKFIVYNKCFNTFGTLPFQFY